MQETMMPGAALEELLNPWDVLAADETMADYDSEAHAIAAFLTAVELGDACQAVMLGDALTELGHDVDAVELAALRLVADRQAA